MYDVALSYLNSGISVVPANASDKSPAVKNLEPLFDRPISLDDAFQEFSVEGVGIGVISGDVSGGLMSIDFDNHFLDAKKNFDNFCSIVEVEEIINKYDFPMETTQSGGFHIFFRVGSVPPSHKCATRKFSPANKVDKNGRKWGTLPDGKDVALNKDGYSVVTIIEVRGNRSYTVCAPTEGYKVISGSISEPPDITPEEQDILLSAARSFNEYADQRDYASTSSYLGGDNDRPGSEYDKDPLSVEESKSILSQAGWKTSNGVHWIRPGKSKGISATFGKVAPNVFYVFSSNAHPFEDRKAYTPWQIYAILEHNFDFENAAKELVKRGYGKKNENLKVVYSTVRREMRKGQKLLPQEINEIAEKLNIPVTTVKGSVEKAEKKYADEWEYEKLPAIKKTEIFLKNNYDFRQDVISRLAYMKVKGGAWEEHNIDTVFRHMQHENIKFPMEKLKSLLRSNYVERYNPFTEYFSKIKPWDGKDRIKELAGCFKNNEPEFFHKMFEKAMVRNIACALNPDYYNRIVFTLISEEQEIGKSWFFQWLNPFGHDYYTDEQLKDNKDSKLALCENFIYNLEELDNLSRVDLAQLKALISKRSVKDRLPYAVNKEHFPRCCSFWGSTNRQEFLTDDKNTRWLCFYVDDIDWGYTSIDKAQLWSQAWSLYNDGDYNYNLTREEGRSRDTANEKYRVVDFEMSLLQKHFTASNTEFMTNADIMAALFDKSEGKIKLNTSPQKLGKILSQLGFQRGRKDNQRGWKVEVKPFDMRPKNDIHEPNF